MAIFTLNTVGSATARTGGRFRRALRRIMPAREPQARRYVNDYLMMFDDSGLATYSMGRKTNATGIHANFPW